MGTWLVKKLNKWGLLQKKKKVRRNREDGAQLFKGDKEAVRKEWQMEGSRSVKKKIGRRIGDDGTDTLRWNLELHERKMKEGGQKEGSRWN